MANELRYGEQIHLQNGYNGWQGGYLDTNGHSGASGGKYAVSTADTPARGKGTGTWEILSASGKGAGQPVMSSDVVYLRNLYGDNGGFLETNNVSTASGGKYDLRTNAYFNRSSDVADWKIHKVRG